jgi:hypothetical protein
MDRWPKQPGDQVAIVTAPQEFLAWRHGTQTTVLLAIFVNGSSLLTPTGRVAASGAELIAMQTTFDRICPKRFIRGSVRSFLRHAGFAQAIRVQGEDFRGKDRRGK